MQDKFIEIFSNGKQCVGVADVAPSNYAVCFEFFIVFDGAADIVNACLKFFGGIIFKKVGIGLVEVNGAVGSAVVVNFAALLVAFNGDVGRNVAAEFDSVVDKVYSLIEVVEVATVVVLAIIGKSRANHDLEESVMGSVGADEKFAEVFFLRFSDVAVFGDLENAFAADDAVVVAELFSALQSILEGEFELVIGVNANDFVVSEENPFAVNLDGIISSGDLSVGEFGVNHLGVSVFGDDDVVGAVDYFFVGFGGCRFNFVFDVDDFVVAAIFGCEVVELEVYGDVAEEIEEANDCEFVVYDDFDNGEAVWLAVVAVCVEVAVFDLGVVFVFAGSGAVLEGIVAVIKAVDDFDSFIRASHFFRFDCHFGFLLIFVFLLTSAALRRFRPSGFLP